MPTPPELDRAAIDRVLALVVTDDRQRTFVLRCILDEGPQHHRVASWALLSALASLVEAAPPGAPFDQAAVPTEAVRMRLPPSVAASADDPDFPLSIPTRHLRRSLANDRELGIAVAALGDGPPHHALANAAMLWLLELLAERTGPTR